MSADFFTPDLERAARCGRPEVIFCAGKTPQQTAEIFASQASKQPFLIGTRATPDHFRAVQSVVPEVVYHPVARILSVSSAPRAENTLRAGVVAAGTSDAPVFEEAAVTLELYGWNVLRVIDVGVAGIHRLFRRMPEIAECSVLIVVAGMEGALASVLGGLLPIPIIAVPTSVGYGAHFGGLAPLLTMLNSCASGTTVVNIDNGFGAAAAADSILRLALKNRSANVS